MYIALFNLYCCVDCMYVALFILFGCVDSTYIVRALILLQHAVPGVSGDVLCLVTQLST
jgi:hypothetical protein